MELYESGLRITYDPDGGSPLVLLDYGDLMTFEPTLPQSHQVQVQPYLRSDWVDVWDRGGVQLGMEVNVLKQYASAPLAREAKFDHALLVAGLRNQKVRIEVMNGTKVYDMDMAAITAAEPVTKREISEKWISFTYSITASHMSAS